jgi:hypothetical protein
VAVQLATVLFAHAVDLFEQFVQGFVGAHYVSMPQEPFDALDALEKLLLLWAV